LGDILEPQNVLLVLAAFSRHAAALDWARQQAAANWGPIALESAQFSFDQTDYYQPTMGPHLVKCFWAFQQPIDPALLVQCKLQTNDWEAQYAREGGRSEPRPLNLDPGYLTLAKLVLASTKDHAHRLYLARGIYAEVTLRYKDGQWQDRDWTFPDYRRADYKQFFSECRDYLRRRQREGRSQ
jgi:hypothetical protein